MADKVGKSPFINQNSGLLLEMVSSNGKADT